DLGEYDKALEYIGKAYSISKEAGRTEDEAVYLNRLGRVYALMGDAETAKAKFEEAISLLPEDHPEAIDSRQRLQKL
ncbi:MAG: tetratricopeptide repeat protein, partial [Muribaculaceae bacterium]|nr:tetratricopeptide repeat protein [Muribaculaceae bacterium]